MPFYTLPLGFALHAQDSKRHGLETPYRDILTAVLTIAVLSILHSRQCIFYLLELLPLSGTEQEIKLTRLLKIRIIEDIAYLSLL